MRDREIPENTKAPPARSVMRRAMNFCAAAGSNGGFLRPAPTCSRLGFERENIPIFLNNPSRAKPVTSVTECMFFLKREEVKIIYIQL